MSGTHQLGGKDIKKLRHALERSFPSLSNEEKEALVPSKAHVTQLKLSNRAIVYAVDANGDASPVPLFFDVTGHGDTLYPTVYALEIHPDIIPSIYTYSEVSTKVLGGADLFLQGIIVPDGGFDPPFLVGSIRSICVPGNPIPFAVGKMAVSLREAKDEGMKGRGLTLIHHFGDFIWQLGNKLPPNDGFAPTRIVPMSPIQRTGTETNNMVEGDVGETHDAVDQVSNAFEDINVKGIAESNDGQMRSSDAAENPPDVMMMQASVSPDHTSKDAAEKAGIDEIVEQAAIGGFKSLRNSELPIMTSDFYAKHMQPLKPSGITFDLKQTKYKKLSKLLDKFAKDKVITLKNIRKQEHIAAVDRNADVIVNWHGMSGTAAADQKDSNVIEESARDNIQGGSGSRGLSDADKKLSIQLLYKCPSSLRVVFGAAGMNEKDRLYTRKEVEAALWTYCMSLMPSETGIQDLKDPESIDLRRVHDHKIKVDEVLVSYLWGKKEGIDAGSDVEFSVVLKRFFAKLQLWHTMKREEIEVTRRGAPKPICIVAEKRHGRSITAVSRVEGRSSLPLLYRYTLKCIAKKYKA